MGKTAFALNIAEKCRRRRQESSGRLLAGNVTGGVAVAPAVFASTVDSHKMRTGSLWREDEAKVARAMEQLAHAPIFIDDTPGIGLSECGQSATSEAKTRRARPDYR